VRKRRSEPVAVPLFLIVTDPSANAKPFYVLVPVSRGKRAEDAQFVQDAEKAEQAKGSLEAE
jgi:hypothetical protein